MTMHSVARRTAIGVAAAATLTLAACGTTASSGSTTPATTATTSAASSTSTAGASMGMSSIGMSAGDMSSTGMDATHNDADVTFTQQMIVHHQGAIAMADLAPTRAASQQVKDLATKIKAAQGPEIAQMTGWLQAWGSGTDMNGMPNTTGSSSAAAGGMGNTGGMGGNETASTSGTVSQMPGMMTPDQMSQLTAATGAEFDKLFLQLMITHHQGAVQMADTELAQGSNPDAQTLAQSIKTSQTQEIATMQQLLTTL